MESRPCDDDGTLRLHERGEGTGCLSDEPRFSDERGFTEREWCVHARLTDVNVLYREPVQEPV
jgi:hypothetical protein